jgi:hypothetical protein
MFDAGDHIKVKRLLYTHHGIYVNDCRVIDFSGGRNIVEKPKALVQPRTLKEFEGKRGGAEQVRPAGKFPRWPRLLARARVGASAPGGRVPS